MTDLFEEAALLTRAAGEIAQQPETPERLRDHLLDAVPEHLRAGLTNYVEKHRRTGGFLEAVLSNDLKEAMGRADERSREGLFAIVCWLYNEAPSTCWGSPERVSDWLRADEHEEKHRRDE